MEILGVGGMATVWRGLDRVLGRQVAVKVLNGGLADDPRFAERFGREAQHAAMLAHPRIAMVFDSGVDQGSPYIVMELVHGRSLSTLLAEQPGLSVEHAVGIGAAVCEALQVAHAAGLVHRDIKPGNIMITYDGGVKVVDFGIARAGSSGAGLTQAATVLGTAAYLSPEQATASEVDGRSDLYAVGCVLTEMLTGQPPFTAATPVAIAFKHVTEQPPALRALRADVPPALEAAVGRLLAKNPAERPPDAASARAELLATVPARPGADRTSELLAAAPPAFPATSAVPATSAGPAAGDQQHTTLLPPVAAGGHQGGPATTLMPPVPAGAGAPYEDGRPDRYDGPGPHAPGRPGRLKPVLIGAVLVAALAGAATLAVSALGSPDTRAASPGHLSTASAAPATGPSGSPSAVRTIPPTTGAPTPARSQGPADVLTAFRQTVAQAKMPKDHDRQGDLLVSLDDAAQALADGRPAGAEQELKNSQRMVRDLVKRHAVDAATGQNWQGRLTALITSIHGSAPSAGGGGNDGND
ncbi:protein kinase [Kitasatospora sp. NBC_00315]|uniref:protein kinase domain-containing protein n=1 Tax=Kitasatospora sp. NBC_00315 TaxID=2975963 RepID=UPI00324C5A05